MAQNQCVFEYCNFGNGYLKIYIPQNKNNLKAKEIYIDLQDYPLEDGVITQIEPVVDRIKFEMKKLGITAMPKIVLLLRCAETYRTILTLPVKNYVQALYFYNKEMKTKVNKELFITANNSYKYGVGYIFNTYYMPKTVTESFTKMAKRLETDIDEIKPFGMALCESMDYKSSYVYFYIRQHSCTMILVSDKDLITSYDFEFEDSKTILNKFLLIASKYEFEFQRKPITHYGMDADNPVQLNLGLKKLSNLEVDEPEKKPVQEKSAPEVVITPNSDAEVDIDWENYDDDPTVFTKRYATCNVILRSRYDALAQKMLSYTDMKCKITDQAAIFYIGNKVYARLDIHNNRVLLYMPLDPKKYINSRYPCALTKRRGFEDTQCLYRIASGFRQEGAFVLISDLVEENGLIPKPKDQ